MPLSKGRLCIRYKEVAKSLYRQGKEYQFCFKDIVHLHYERKTKRAKVWAQETIRMMRKKGYVVRLDLKYLDPDRRVMWYRLTNDALRKWEIPWLEEKEELPEPPPRQLKALAKRKKTQETRKDKYVDGKYHRGFSK